jgi:FkbM family methyltransferase
MIQRFLENSSLDKTLPYVIFDVGSRDCLQSIEFYHQFPNSKIYAFECNPNTISICKQNIEKYTDRITLIEGAVCDYDGEITFYPINQQKTITSWEDGNPGASSLFKSNGTYVYEHYVQDEIRTKCHRLDTILKIQGIPKVDIIWMDLQGAELLALKGLGEYLTDVQFIYTEVSHKEMYTGQVMFNEFHSFMTTREFVLNNKLSMTGWQEDAIYQKKRGDFDIVIPIGPNDQDVIAQQVRYTQRNILGYRNIYLICKDACFQLEGCITIPEDIFPFSIQTVSNYHGPTKRHGWYLQQLLKLYAGVYVPDILDKYLVIDADTFFLKPTSFYKRGKCLYNYGSELHNPYFNHMQELHPGLCRRDPAKSGICHHMIFETRYVKELLIMVEKYHSDEFYKLFLKKVTDIHGAGASEYEIYFNYMLWKHSDEIEIRPLHWKNTSDLSELMSDYDYISYHHYIRN